MHVSDFEGAIKQIVRKVNIYKATLANDHEDVAFTEMLRKMLSEKEKFMII